MCVYGWRTAHVSVLVSESCSAAEPDAVNDAGVVEFVRDDSVIAAQQCLKQTGVRVETARVQQGVVAPVKLRDTPLQLLV